MTKVVVIGAGIGGVPMAFELKEMLGKAADVQVVSDSEWFQFVPSNPWVAVNWRTADQVKVHLPRTFAKLNIGFNASGAKRIDPANNVVHLGDGSRLDYDFLVIATGPKLAFDEIEGLGPQANTNSICDVGHATQAGKKWEAFCRDPGPMVVGAVQGASCYGPAYEYAMLAVTELRRRKIRDRVPMTFLTPEPYIGHLGLGGVGDTKGLLESVMRDRDIKWITNAKIDRIAPDGVEATEVNEDGSPKKAYKLPSKYTMFIPAFRGVDCLRGEDGKWIEGLTNPRGFVLADKHQRNPKYPNVFSVGVCVAIPPYEATPLRGRHAEDGIHDRIDGDGDRAQHSGSDRGQGRDPRALMECGLPCGFRRQRRRIPRDPADSAAQRQLVRPEVTGCIWRKSDLRSTSCERYATDRANPDTNAF